MKALLSTCALIAIAYAGPVLAQQTQGQAQSAPAPTMTKPLGLVQDAWNEKLRTRGESKVNPGYVRYTYNPANVFPIRTRESMITTIKLPDDEELLQAFTGDDQGFQVAIPTPNSIAIKALFPGVDTNLVAYTKDGKIFTFYVRSEGYNSRNPSDFLVDVVMPGKGVLEGSQLTNENQVLQDARYPARTAERVRDPYGSLSPDKRERYREYAEWTDFDPGTVVDDLGVYVPRKEAGGTIPYRVFRDDRFTYIDYGPNAAQLTEWPTPLIVVQGVEGPVGFRTAGPGGRMIVLEALGSFVMRNGQRMIVIKPRREANPRDKSLIEFPVAGVGSMVVPRDLPPGRPASLVAAPKTVVPTNGPVTADGEAPSAVVALPHNRQIEAAGGSAAQPGLAKITEIPAPAPATPIRSVVASGSAITAAGIAIGHAPARTTAPKGASTPVMRTDVQAAADVTAPAASANKDAVIIAAATARSPQPSAASVLRATTDASALASYKVVIGRGPVKQIEERWKSYQAQHANALAGKTMSLEPQADGTFAMALVPIASISEGMHLCALMGADGMVCAVKPTRGQKGK